MFLLQFLLQTYREWDYLYILKTKQVPPIITYTIPKTVSITLSTPPKITKQILKSEVENKVVEHNCQKAITLKTQTMKVLTVKYMNK